MTATERLRELLDERGVEWNAIDGDSICFTEWWTHDGAFVYTARESFRSYRDNDLRVETCGIPRSCLIATPEQAISATLGPGTCELHDCEGIFSVTRRPIWRCDCGAFMTQYTDATTYHKPRFCPNCGRKVVDE